MSPAATVVLSTYNRPDALRVAIRSVLRQTRPDWRLWVIGDHCSPATEEVVRSLPDPRVSYFNLTFRFGEQAGPNSVGMALADTDYVALLNHDDAWLPDHLERALATLSATGADIFIGRAAVASRSVAACAGGATRRPLFDKATPFPGPPRHHLFHRHFVVCEPASACVFRTSLARRVGPWRSHRVLHRSPLQDWFLRLWRHGAAFAYGEEITLLNLGSHYERCADAGRRADGKRRDWERDEELRPEAGTDVGGCYAAASLEHAWVDDLLERLTAEGAREELRREASGSPGARALRPRRSRKAFRASNPAARLLLHLAVNRVTAYLYRRTGVDLYSTLMTLSGKRRGEAMRELSRLRTGWEPPEHADFSRAVERAVASLRATANLRAAAALRPAVAPARVG